MSASRDPRTPLGPNTTLVAAGRDPFQQHGFVNPPTYRGSTVLYPTAEDLFAHRSKYSYGRRGSPTIDALAGAINEIEAAAGTVLTPSGLSAVTTAMLSAVRAGDHFLVVDSAYNPGRHFCDTTLKDFGVETTYYDPLIGAGVADQFRPNTKAILVESPGSLTFDVQDVPAIVEVAHKAGILVLMDNTWATPLFFKPLDHGVDISIQAGTKYISGHSDIMIGTVSANRDAWARLHNTHGNLGLTVGPDDISLALRGLRTMGVRLARHQETALTLARWLQGRPEITQVMYPGLETDPGHAIWKRDFSGASGLFGVELREGYSQTDIERFLNSLTLFGMGYSWGGFESLIIPFDTRGRTLPSRFKGRTLRIHAGLEDAEDLIADLDRALPALQG